MVARTRTRALLLLALLGFAFNVSGDYLLALGPAPLRWQAARPPRPEVLRSLPPLVILEEPPPEAAGARDATNSIAGKASNTGPAGNSARAAGVETAGGAAAGGRNAGQSPALPPEALTSLFYCPSGTNRLPVAVLPLDFVPPPAPAARSSSATYSIENP